MRNCAARPRNIFCNKKCNTNFEDFFFAHSVSTCLQENCRKESITFANSVQILCVGVRRERRGDHGRSLYLVVRMHIGRACAHDNRGFAVSAEIVNGTFTCTFSRLRKRRLYYICKYRLSKLSGRTRDFECIPRWPKIAASLRLSLADFDLARLGRMTFASSILCGIRDSSCISP
jgi:hypothetical protein